MDMDMDVDESAKLAQASRKTNLQKCGRGDATSYYNDSGHLLSTSDAVFGFGDGKMGCRCRWRWRCVIWITCDENIFKFT